MAEHQGRIYRRKIRHELTQKHFDWILDCRIVDSGAPPWAMVVERYSGGRLYGVPTAFFDHDEVIIDVQSGHEQQQNALRKEIWERYLRERGAVAERLDQIRSMEKYDIGAINHETEVARLAVRQAAIDCGHESPQHQAAIEEKTRKEGELTEEYNAIREEIAKLREINDRYSVSFELAAGPRDEGSPPPQPQTVSVGLDDIVRMYPPNQLSTAGKWGVYGSRWGEFFLADPREANTEGGVWPPIVGTVTMTLLMAIVVVPFGVLAALYLREYAKAGPMTSAVRIAINNLAGVPSIVFGAFGFGFFCYGVGGFIDGGPEKIELDPWTAAGWTTALLIWLGALAAGLFLLFAFRGVGEDSRAGRGAKTTLVIVWIGVMLVDGFLIVGHVPFFSGLYEAKLPSPTFGKPAVIWASLTLALLTLPVVIVATEEALAAVPNSMREGSYACGGSKWQTIRRIVLPHAMPGIMTGTILAMARGAGEVAPLMLTGAMKAAPELPVDNIFPYIHIDRSFMHLGFHIYDVAFQSQNSEAAKSLVFTTTLLLIAIIAILNLLAIWLRGRLRKRFISGQF